MKKGFSLIEVLIACFIIVALLFSISYALGAIQKIEKRAASNLRSYLLAEEEMERTKMLDKDPLLNISGKSFANNTGNIFTRKVYDDLYEIKVICHRPDGQSFSFATMKYFEQ